LAEDGKEIFFHGSELQNVDFDELGEGDHLEFTIVKGEKVPRLPTSERPANKGINSLYIWSN